MIFLAAVGGPLLGGFEIAKLCDTRLYAIGVADIAFCGLELFLRLIIGICAYSSSNPIMNMTKFTGYRVCILLPLFLFATIYSTIVVSDLSGGFQPLDLDDPRTACYQKNSPAGVDAYKYFLL